MASVATVLVKHPADPTIALRVNASDAGRFQPWESPAPESVRGIFDSQGWQGLKRLADQCGYSKPPGQSWASSIPEIEALYGQ